MKYALVTGTDHGLVPQLDLLVNSAGILGDMYKVLGDELDNAEMLQVINVNAFDGITEGEAH